MQYVDPNRIFEHVKKLVSSTFKVLNGVKNWISFNIIQMQNKIILNTIPSKMCISSIYVPKLCLVYKGIEYSNQSINNRKLSPFFSCINQLGQKLRIEVKYLVVDDVTNKLRGKWGFSMHFSRLITRMVYEFYRL